MSSHAITTCSNIPSCYNKARKPNEGPTAKPEPISVVLVERRGVSWQQLRQHIFRECENPAPNKAKLHREKILVTRFGQHIDLFFCNPRQDWGRWPIDHTFSSAWLLHRKWKRDPIQTNQNSVPSSKNRQTISSGYLGYTPSAKTARSTTSPIYAIMSIKCEENDWNWRHKCVKERGNKNYFLIVGKCVLAYHWEGKISGYFTNK